MGHRAGWGAQLHHRHPQLAVDVGRELTRRDEPGVDQLLLERSGGTIGDDPAERVGAEQRRPPATLVLAVSTATTPSPTWRTPMPSTLKSATENAQASPTGGRPLSIVERTIARNPHAERSGWCPLRRDTTTDGPWWGPRW